MRLPILGILILMAFVVSGYVASRPHDDALPRVASAHADQHVAYYEQHLRSLGLPEPDAQATMSSRPRVIYL